MDEKVKEIEVKFGFPKIDFYQTFKISGGDIYYLLSLLSSKEKELEEKNHEIEKLRGDLDYWEKKSKDLESNLKLNASLLAKQTDLARDAETKVKELEGQLKRIKDDPSIGKLEVEGEWPESPDY